jgi:hypothetical protein
VSEQRTRGVGLRYQRVSVGAENEGYGVEIPEGYYNCHRLVGSETEYRIEF